jgi:hypothetical protein
MTPDDVSALSFLCARVLKKEAEVASSRVITVTVSPAYTAYLTPLRGQK